MKIKCDENIPRGAAVILQKLGHEADTVWDEKLSGVDDVTVWDACQKEGRFLITQDLDFSDLNRFSPGAHCGLMLVRLPQDEQSNVNAWLQAWFSDDAESWERCIVVATDRKIRVRR